MGGFALISTVYGFSLTLATSGIQLATTRLISEAVSSDGSRDEYRVKLLLKKCILYAIFFGFISTLLLLTLSKFIGIVLLDDVRTVLPLRILSLTLTPIALGSVFNGYFTAIRKVWKNAAVQVLCEGIRIFCCMFLLTLCVPGDIQFACLAVILGGTVSEILAFSIHGILFILERRKANFKCSSQNQKIASGILSKIALPMAFSAYIRSALVTIEHLLIPKGLQKSGNTREQSLAAYGTLQSMVMPLVLFPSAIIHSFSGLLVPELAELKIQNNKREIKYVAERVCHLALTFAVGVSGIMIYFANELGVGIYGSTDAGQYIRFVAHIVPIMYLDTTVDNILKGLGEHLYTMTINITDTLCSLVMVWILIPKMGIYGYITLIIVSEIFNSGASILKLVKVAKMRFKLIKWFALPVISIILSTWTLGVLRELITISTLPAILLTTLLYFALLRITRAIGKEEIAWAKAVFKF